MLCISESAKYRIILHHGGRRHFTATGEVERVERSLTAEFQPGVGLPPWGQQKALETFQFRGLPPDIDPLTQVGYFDSAEYARNYGLDDGEKAILERRLREEDGNGFIIIEQQLAPLPGGLKNYVKLTTVVGRRTEEHVVEKVRELVNDLGLSPDEIVAYERDHPRPESAAIVAAVQPPVEEREAETVVAA